ncbi:MAG TPA: transporter substrate-binding domain-containing protein [Candidatus Acidoferrales bacterium]|nr:transporter substrate-binding domain-containing protein [Candidatus Acidoferrales bacterium]
MFAGLLSIRCKVVLLCLMVLPISGCILFIAHDLPNPPAPAPTEAPQPSGTLLKSQLRIGMSADYPPLTYKDGAFGLVGVEVDLAKQLGEGLGKEISFVEIPFPELINALVEDRVDIIMSGMSVTTERLKLVNFTDPYAPVGQMALIRAKDLALYPNVQVFSNTTQRVGFVQNTTGELAARGVFLQAKIVPQATIEEGVLALRKGDIDVFIHDAPTIWRIAGNPNEQELKGLYWRLTNENLAWAVRKGDDPLRFAINQQLAQLKDSGRLKQILSRWVTVRIW